jgi:hypothetical protein
MFSSRTSGILHLIARDWSAEHQPQRDATYAFMVEELERFFGDEGDRADVTVVVPGCGMGRLPYEVAKAGFKCIAGRLFLISASLTAFYTSFEDLFVILLFLKFAFQ